MSVSNFLKFLQEELPGLAASSAFVFRSIAFLFIYYFSKKLPNLISLYITLYLHADIPFAARTPTVVLLLCKKWQTKKWNSTTKALISRTEFHPM
jgi:hypothetical protein